VQVASRRSTEASAAGTSSSLNSGNLALLVPRASHVAAAAAAGRASSSVSLGSDCRPSSAASGSVVGPLPSAAFAWSAQEQLLQRDSWRNQAAGSDPGGRLQVSTEHPGGIGLHDAAVVAIRHTFSHPLLVLS
jgi:hypothetical protein